MLKAILTLSHGLHGDKAEVMRKRVAEHLNMPVENVLLLDGATVSLVEVSGKAPAKPQVAPPEPVTPAPESPPAPPSPPTETTHYRKGKTE